MSNDTTIYINIKYILMNDDKNILYRSSIEVDMFENGFPRFSKRFKIIRDIRQSMIERESCYIGNQFSLLPINILGKNPRIEFEEEILKMKSIKDINTKSFLEKNYDIKDNKICIDKEKLSVNWCNNNKLSLPMVMINTLYNQVGKDGKNI